MLMTSGDISLLPVIFPNETAVCTETRLELNNPQESFPWLTPFCTAFVDHIDGTQTWPDRPYDALDVYHSTALETEPNLFSHGFWTPSTSPGSCGVVNLNDMCMESFEHAQYHTLQPTHAQYVASHNESHCNATIPDNDEDHEFPHTPDPAQQEPTSEYDSSIANIGSPMFALADSSESLPESEPMAQKDSL